MFLSVGTDIEEIARFESILKNHRMMKRCFSDAERAYFEARGAGAAESAAAAYCAKEAFGKAVGTGITIKMLSELEVLHDAAGMPFLKLHGQLAKQYAALRLSVSLSHSANYATATVLAYRESDEATGEIDGSTAHLTGGDGYADPTCG